MRLSIVSIIFITVAFLFVTEYKIRTQERIVLTVPEAASSITHYRIVAYRSEEDNPNTPANDARFIIDLDGVQRESPVRCEYNSTTTPTGQAVTNALKTRDFSTPYAGNNTTGNLHQAIFHRLVRLGDAAFACNKNLTGTVQ